VSEALLSRAWLDAEIDRIWLSAEAELRRLQQLQLRPAIAEIESMLAERRAARAGKPSPFDAGELSGAIADALHRLPALRRPAIDRLSRRLGLSFGDIGGLLLVAAPSIDPPLADLFAALRGPGLSRRGVDLALIGQLLASGRERRIELLDLLDEQRPPAMHRLIQIAPAQDVYSSASYRAIQPTLDLLWLLTTPGDTSSPSLRGSASIVRAAASWEGLVLDGELRGPLDRLAQRFAAGAAALPWVALWGAPGSGKREIASRLAAWSGRPLLSVDPRRADGAPPLDLVRRACRDAAWLGAALYVGPFGVDELHAQPLIARELERCQEPVLIGFESTRAPRLRTASPLVEYAVAIPHAPSRIALWNQALAGMAVAPGTDLATLARGYKLTPGEILASGREVGALAGPGAIDDALLRTVMERRLRNELGAVATRLVVDTSWDDVVLPAEARGRVRELISRKVQEDRVYRAWGLDQRIGYGKGLIALFSGPPGTGKTLLAGLIARELGYELYQIDLSQIFSRWIGETEKALDQVFDQAERAHAVLLFDEADALFARRTEVEDSNDRYANVAVNFLLQRLERYTGVAVLTTNKDSYLDEALRRRLTLHLQLEEPEAAERLLLWRKHLPRTVPGADTVDLASLAADYPLTGGYIKNVAVRATFLSAAENVPLSTQQIRRAAALELEDLGRVVTWPTEPGPEDLGRVASWPTSLDEPRHAPIEVVDYVEG
jgi:AAA+ superfamily predicted ATPase